MHFMKRPRRQNQHLPHATKKEPTARSPSSNSVTPSPLASIVPRYSWPSDEPLLHLDAAVVGMQVGAADRGAVDAQQHVSGSSISGRGTSSTRTSCGPWKTTACMVAMPPTLSNNPVVAAPLFELRDVTLSRGRRGRAARRERAAPGGRRVRRGPVRLRQVDPAAAAEPARRPRPRRGPLPRPGRARVRGAELRREVCLVPQLPALLEGTVADNIAFAARLAASSRQRPPARARRPRRVVRGSRRRPAVGRRAAARDAGASARAGAGRAAARHEPTSALDERRATAVERTLLELRERLGLSCVLVTHDPEQAARMADWVLRLDAGRIRVA